MVKATCLCINIKGHNGVKQGHIGVHQKMEKNYFTPKPCTKRGKKERKRIKGYLTWPERLVSQRKLSDYMKDDIDFNRIRSKSKIRKV